MQIVHITNAGGYGRLQNGGAERAVVELSSALADNHGWQEAVIAPEGFFAGRDFSPNVKLYGVELSAFRLADALNPRGELQRTLARVQPTVVMTHLLRGTLAGLPAARLATRACRISVLHNSLHDYQTDSAAAGARHRLNCYAFRVVGGHFAHAHIAISEANRLDLIKRDKVRPDRAQVIYNWVSAQFNLRSAQEAKVATRKSLGLAAGHRVVAVVGRLEAQKQQDYLIKLLPVLEDVYLVIVGGGERAQLYKDIAQQLGVADRVIFTGFRTDIGNLMGAADLVAMPSLFEGFGRVAVESLAVGTPVIASDLASVREVISSAPANAVSLVPLEDHEAWINETSRMLQHTPTAEERATMADYIQSRFSLKAAASAYDRLLRCVIEKRRAPCP